MRIRNIVAVTYKQWLDASSVKSIVAQFLLYPALLLVFSIGRDTSARMLMLSILAPMFIGSSPMLTVHSLIREDKTSGALRAMMLAAVRPGEYMAGVSGFLLGISALSSVLIGILSGLPPRALLLFTPTMILASLLTLLLGCAASLHAANQSNAVLFITVLSLLNGMIPVLETVHPAIHPITRFWYTQQIRDMILSLSLGQTETLPLAFGVIGVNLAVILLALTIAYRRTRLFEV